MKYAVIVSGSKQYRVSEGDIITTDLLPVKKDDLYTFSKVLLVVDGGEKQFGFPLVADVPVTGKVLAHKQGEKIRVSRFRAKSRYRKVTGYRHQLTEIKIESIGKKTEPDKKIETETVEKITKKKTVPQKKTA